MLIKKLLLITLPAVLFFLSLSFTFTAEAQFILDTGDISQGLTFDSGLYNNFGDLYSSPHIFAKLKYGLSRSTEIFGYIDFGKYFKGPQSKTGVSAGAGARFALVKEGELDHPISGHFGIKGDADIISGIDIYNIYANVCFSYNLIDTVKLKPYLSLGLHYNNSRLYLRHESNLAEDNTNLFATLGTEYEIDRRYSVLGEFTFSEEITIAVLFRINM